MTKVTSSKKRLGRPPIGERAMTAAERDQRRRSRDALHRRPWWERPKAQQKADIEGAVREFLDLERDLNDREKYFLAEALSAVARGMFGIALQAILDVNEPDCAFSSSYKISQDQVNGINKGALRKYLRYSEASPVQEIPIFR